MEQLNLLTRRIEPIAVPGANPAQANTSLSIPVPPDNQRNTTNSGQVRPSYQTVKQQQQLRARARRREESLNLSEIESVEFSLYSTEEIDAHAVVNVSSPEEYGPGTVRDLKMGPHNKSQPCDTCSSDLDGCPGHYGKIIIPRLMHPLAVNSIILVLSCVCNSCGGLLVTRSEIEQAGINRLRDEKRLKAIKELVKKLSRNCQRYKDIPGARNCDPNPVYTSLKENKDDYRLAYTYPGGDKKTKYYRLPDVPLNSDENSIYKILDAISETDAETLGFTNTHPRNMIIERMVVIPWCARPDLFQGNRFHPDDLTTMYRDIVRDVKAYNDPKNSEAAKDADLRTLYWHIIRFMKNDGKYSQGGVKIYTDVKKRIQGKTAIVRANIMGKRVNFAGRTVIGPAAYLRVDQIGIPRLMAMKLTRPVKVNGMNRAELQEKLDSGKVIHIEMKNGPSAGFRQLISDSFRQRFPNYRLNLGDVVERMLEDGDLVLFNRQPSLHRHSILAAYAKIIDDRIVRINLSVTTPLNADFDGDEINIHVPQTIESYAEAEQLMGVYRNLMSSETNKPVMGIVYDTLSGAYLLTYPQYEFEKLEREISKLQEKMEDIPAGTEKYQQLEESMNTAIARKETVEKRIILDPVIYNQAIIEVSDTPQYQTLGTRLAKYGVDPRSGRGLISATFPEEFDYSTTIDIDNKPVHILIKNGILIRGVLSKDTLGHKDGSIIAEMYKQLGGVETVDFMSNIQFVVREFLQQHGLTVGIDDCIPDAPSFRKQVDEALSTATLKVLSLSGRPANKVVAQRQERKIVETLDSAKTSTENIIQKYFKPDNGVLIMAGSGAKGSVFNTVQMSSALGQQKVSNQRISTNLPGNRSLPVFEPNDPNPRARGFCSNSFSSGMEPSEFFFHAQGGREGLTDTAINTARTGHLQHQIVKSAEDVHVSPDGSVRAADNSIVDFVYGGDGFDPAELTSVPIKGEKIPFFRNFQQLANRVNRKYGSQ
jgi:DNA-directed RNA polymerase II subunit RPB1